MYQEELGKLKSYDSYSHLEAIESELREYEGMKDPFSEAYTLREDFQKEYQAIQSNISKLNNLEELDDAKAEPHFSGVTTSLWDIYNLMIKLKQRPDPQHVGFDITEAQYERLEKQLYENVSDLQVKTARLVLKKFKKKAKTRDIGTQEDYDKRAENLIEGLWDRVKCQEIENKKQIKENQRLEDQITHLN